MIKGIRLNKSEIDETWQGIELFDDFKAIANAATDKAIKKIDELLIFCKRDVGGINPEWAICDKNYQELKKLVRGIAPGVKE